MKALRRHAFGALALIAGSAAIAPVALHAQPGRRVVTADPNAKRLMVPTFRAPDRGLGVEAAKVLRARIGRDLPPKAIWVIPENDISTALKASGYDPEQALSPQDAKELARMLRADEVLQGQVTRTPEGFRVDARLMLARDVALVQPLPSATAPKLDDAARAVSKNLEAARRQLEANQRCENFSRERKYAEAIAAAREGIAAYPQATLARLCIAGVYQAQNMPPDSIIAITEQIRAIDPNSRLALTLATSAYRTKGDTTKLVTTLGQLLTADPTNLTLRQQVVAEFARLKRYGEAADIVKKALEDNPGDPDLMRLAWLVNLGAERWDDAITLGEQFLTQNDTAVVDSTFFGRLSAAYAADSQPQKALETVMRGIQKYPNNADMHLAAAQMYRNQGQLQLAQEEARKAAALNPKAERVWLMIAQAQVDMNQPDSAIASLRTSLANGEDKSLVAQYALAQGNTWYKKANQSKARPEFEQAIRYLTVSDSIAPSPEAKFLLGVSSYYVGQLAATEAGQSKSCDLTRLADESLTAAQINVAQGGSVSPDAAKQVLGAVQQLTPFVARQKKAFCKGRGD
ncbi:MAG TPA: tetratricopeptide repeat protein [Gemmatimonadaceae bacterium]|nr:tetratricopeptide repeat protein [Gemmatimonadaceae bacterium]